MPSFRLVRGQTVAIDSVPMWRESAIRRRALPSSRFWLVTHSLRPAVLTAWFKGALFKYGIGPIKEDGQQMPGVFLLKEREIVRALRHRTIADVPDYLKLAGVG